MQLSLTQDLVKHLDIAIWKLRYPIILKKHIPFQLLINLKLLIISDVQISLNDTFIQDVIQSMGLTNTEIHIIIADQINTLILPKNFLRYCWCLGEKILCHYHCLTFKTPSLSKLKFNINAKRNLWNQINIHLK